MRFGLQIDTTQPGPAGAEWDTMLAATQLAEEVGFESVWYEDHFMWRDDNDPEKQSPRLECLTTLAALAALTKKVRLGMLVLGVPYRNPALVAKMMTTIDLISHGRVIVGLGAAWHEQEFDAYGWTFPSRKERFEMLEDAAQIIGKMLSEHSASYQGKHFSIDRALNDPPTVQRPRPPIMIAGNGEKQTLRLVARYADMCNVYGSPADCQRLFAVLQGHCEDAGRPYDAITRTINYWGLLARDEQERRDKAKRFPNSGAVDLPATMISTLKEYEAAGVQYAIVKLLDGADLNSIRTFAETVLPAFTNSAA